MLLIDGAKYEEWIPEKEVEEYQPIIREHLKDIFGEKSLILDEKELKSEAGLGSQPDWIVITFGSVPKWHIVEAEFSSHPVYDHIMNQVGRFIVGIKKLESRNKILNEIYAAINEDDTIKKEIEKAINSRETYKFLSELISSTPSLTIVIEKKTPILEEALSLINHPWINIIEFRIFKQTPSDEKYVCFFDPIETKNYNQTGISSSSKSSNSKGKSILDLEIGDTYGGYILEAKKDNRQLMRNPKNGNLGVYVYDNGQQRALLSSTTKPSREKALRVLETGIVE